MKKILILSLIVTNLFLTSCSSEQEQKVEKYYKTVIISTGSITETQNYIGYIKGETQTMLATKAPGKITYLPKNIGDRIYYGELIASLDSAEAKTNYSTANSIAGSLNSLKQATDQSFDEQIKAMKSKIDQAKAGLKGVNIGLEDTKKITNSQLETAKIGLKTTKSNLEETKNILSTKKENILAGSKSAITQNVILSENIIDFIDKFLGITHKNKDFNDKYEDYIGVKNTKKLKETKDSFNETKKMFDDYEKFFEEKIENKNPSEEELIIGLKKAEMTSEQIKSLLELTYDTLDYSLENLELPLSMLTEYKKQISIFGSNLEKTLISMSGDTMIGIKGSLENLNSFESEKKKAIILLEKQIELAEKQVIQYENMANGEVNNVKTKKEVAEKQLEEAQAGLKSLIAGKNAKLKEVDSKISEVLGKRNLSAVYINNGKIYSPVNGIIVSKNAEVSQVIGAGMPIYTIASDNNLKVQISVPSFVSKSLKLNDKIKVTIQDTNKSYTGTIIQLPEIQNNITKKVDLEILINNKNKDISIGTMADVSFTINNIIENNELGTTLIPNNAIIQKYMIPGVYVVTDNKAIFTQIEIISSSNNYSLIKGIKVNSKIITQGKDNIYDGEELNLNN